MSEADTIRELEGELYDARVDNRMLAARAEQAEAERDAARSSADAASKAASDNAQRANVAEAALRWNVEGAREALDFTEAEHLPWCHSLDPNVRPTAACDCHAATTPGESDERP